MPNGRMRKSAGNRVKSMRRQVPRPARRRPHRRPSSYGGVAKCAVPAQSADIALAAGQASPGSLDRRDALRAHFRAPAAAAPARPQDQASEGRVGIRYASKCGARSAARAESGEASPLWRKHPGRSPSSRSSRTRRAVSSSASTGLRLCKRSRSSARVGRSAISRISDNK